MVFSDIGQAVPFTDLFKFVKNRNVNKSQVKTNTAIKQKLRFFKYSEILKSYPKILFFSLIVFKWVSMYEMSTQMIYKQQCSTCFESVSRTEVWKLAWAMALPRPQLRHINPPHHPLPLYGLDPQDIGHLESVNFRTQSITINYSIYIFGEGWQLLLPGTMYRLKSLVQ